MGALGYSHFLLECLLEGLFIRIENNDSTFKRDLIGETQNKFFENSIKKDKGKKNIGTKRRYESRMWSVFICTVE